MIWNYIIVVCPFLWSVVRVDFALQAPQISSPTSQEVVFCLRKNYQRGVSRVICDLTWFIYIYLLFLFQRFFLPQDPHIHQLKHLILYSLNLLPAVFWGPRKWTVLCDFWALYTRFTHFLDNVTPKKSKIETLQSLCCLCLGHMVIKSFPG